MTSRDRVIAAIEHRPVDRVPVMITSVEDEVIRDARRKDANHLRDALKCDIRLITFGAPARYQEIDNYLSRLDTDAYVGDVSQLRTYVEWDYAPPTAKDPTGRNPLSKANSPGDIDAYSIPDRDLKADLGKLRRQVDDFHERGLAVAGLPPHLGGQLFETAQRLRGFERFCEDLILRPDLADYLLDQLTQMQIEYAIVIAQAGCDIICLDDDMGHPTGLLISPQTYQRFFKPRMARIIQAAQAVNSDIKIFYHSDGDITAILDDLVEIGVQVIEPVQPDCMDPAAIRGRYGTHLAFWGTVGPPDMWRIGGSDDIRDEVRLRVESLGGRGLILAPAYDFSVDFGVEKLNAFFTAAERCGQPH